MTARKRKEKKNKKAPYGGWIDGAIYLAEYRIRDKDKNGHSPKYIRIVKVFTGDFNQEKDENKIYSVIIYSMILGETMHIMGDLISYFKPIRLLVLPSEFAGIDHTLNNADIYSINEGMFGNQQGDEPIRKISV